MIGRTVSHYRILEMTGQGGRIFVFAAYIQTKCSGS